MSREIILAGQPRITEEFDAGETLTPGQLVEVSSLLWVTHIGAGLNTTRTFVLPRDEGGLDIDDTYLTTSGRVKVGHFSKGQKVRAFAASGQTLVRGESYMESAGDGTLRILTTDTATDDTQRESIVGLMAETVTTSALTRIEVEIV